MPPFHTAVGVDQPRLGAATARSGGAVPARHRFPPVHPHTVGGAGGVPGARAATEPLGGAGALQIKLLEVEGQSLPIAEFLAKAIDPPVPQAIKAARQLLEDIGGWWG